MVTRRAGAVIIVVGCLWFNTAGEITLTGDIYASLTERYNERYLLNGSWNVDVSNLF